MSDNPASPNPYSAPGGDLSVQASESGTLAGRGQRFAAAIIDGIIIGLIALVPLILFFGGWTNYAAAAQQKEFLIKLVGFVIGLTAYLVVNGALLAKDGQTVGKKLVGIKIVRTDGSKPDFARLIVRRYLPTVVVQLIPVIGIFLPLIDVLLIFRESKKCFHDDIADTIVVRV